jgi:hypothetical protein
MLSVIILPQTSKLAAEKALAIVNQLAGCAPEVSHGKARAVFREFSFKSGCRSRVSRVAEIHFLRSDEPMECPSGDSGLPKSPRFPTPLCHLRLKSKLRSVFEPNVIFRLQHP